jgi:TRAP-type mannitol/chloroaromatic compound transport system permease large subunit
MSGTEVLAILMLVAFFGLLMIGVPVALTLATTGFVFGFLGFGAGLFSYKPGSPIITFMTTDSSFNILIE